MEEGVTYNQLIALEILFPYLEPPEEVIVGTQQGQFSLLPPPKDHCQVCAVQHDPRMPHNKESLYYQTRFNMQAGRVPDWRDALYHCDAEVREFWVDKLGAIGQWPWPDDAQPEPYPNDPDFLKEPTSI